MNPPKPFQFLYNLEIQEFLDHQLLIEWIPLESIHDNEPVLGHAVLKNLNHLEPVQGI